MSEGGDVPRIDGSAAINICDGAKSVSGRRGLPEPVFGLVRNVIARTGTGRRHTAQLTSRLTAGPAGRARPHGGPLSSLPPTQT